METQQQGRRSGPIVRRHNQARHTVGHELGNPADVGRHDGQSRGHCLDEHVRNAIAVAVRADAARRQKTVARWYSPSRADCGIALATRTRRSTPRLRMRSITSAVRSPGSPMIVA